MMGLKEKRRQTGMSQKEAAEFFGIKYRTYQNYENGVTSPSMETAAKFARFFNCSIGDLFDLEEGMKRYEEGEDKKHLIELFLQLNDEGRSLLIEYADTLVKSSKYEKKSMSDYQILENKAVNE